MSDDPRCPWCGENHPTELIRLWGDLATTCPKLGANGVVFGALPPDQVAKTDPIAAARTPDDGSLVVVYQPASLEARAFGATDLDARGLPRWKP